MDKQEILKIGKKIIQIMMVIQIILAIIFIIKNINYIPEYGDTPEYIELSKTFQLPSYRTFVYPGVLNIADKIANLLNINMTYVIYVIQNAINLFTCVLLIKTLKETFNVNLSRKETILYSLFIFSVPLNLHF